MINQTFLGEDKSLNQNSQLFNRSNIFQRSKLDITSESPSTFVNRAEYEVDLNKLGLKTNTRIFGTPEDTDSDK